MRIGLAVCTCAAIKSIPNQCRFIFSACKVHSAPLLIPQSPQKNRMKKKTIAILPSVRSPSLLKVSFKYPRPAGGTCTILLRPPQKNKVAINIAIPGIPNAQPGPYFGFASSQGQRIEEIKEPALIEK